jgi:phage terminase large subunit GpA-like protein
MATQATLLAPRWSIPPFETGGQILARLAHLAEPREKQSGSDWARNNTTFDLDALPWHAEVIDALTDDETAEVGLLGPAQAGKSTIGLSWIGWVIDQAPDNFFLCQPDRSATTKFVVSRVDPFIKDTKAVRSKLSTASNANNMLLKQFQGMFLYSVWPVPGQFIQVPARYGWLDDFDQMADDIGGTEDQAGQGSAIALLEGRLTTRKGRDTKFVSSSPADESGGKTEAFVDGGTDERLWPECPSCGDRWEIDLRRDLRFDDTGDEDLAERTAHVNCAANGCELAPSDRRALLNSLARLPNRGFVASRPTASKRRRTFRIDGLLAFTSWPDLARSWREAQRTWALRQDEGPLRTFMNTKAGVNYRSILSGEKPLKSSELAARREPDFAMGTVPAGVRVIVIVVDAQATSFECAAIGFGDKLESWLIDRWAMQVYSDGTPIRPFGDSPDRIAEALLPLWRMTWPLADGSGQSPPPLSVAIDTGGGGGRNEDSWTSSVKALWHRATAPLARGGSGIERKRITLIKGGNNPRNPKLMPPAEFADRKMKGGARRNSPDLWMPNVHRIKNIIDARLRIAAAGAGYIHLPGADRPGSRKRLAGEGPTGISDEYLDEITAEELKDGSWKKLRPRNETWDHLVYAYASLLKPPFAQSRDHMRWVPAAHRVPEQSAPAAIVVIQPEAKPVDPIVRAKPKTRPRRPNPYLPRR